MRRSPTMLGIAALLLSGLGALLCCEVLRPFRDLSIDGPLALGSWAAGTAAAIACFFLKGRSFLLTIAAVVLNVVPLVGALLLLWALSRSNFLWH